MIVTAHIKFGLHSNFLDSMLQAEDERFPGETVEDGAIRVYKKLENAVERLKKEHEAMRGVQETYPQPFQNPNRFDHITDSKQPAIVFYERSDVSPESTLADIQKAKSLEELRTYKLLASGDKELYNAYNQRIKILSDNGGQ